MKKQTVVLGLSKLSIPHKIEKARFIVTSMTNNPNFPSPVPALADIAANATALEDAHVHAQGGGVDDTAAMHAKERVLDLSLKSLAAYVEALANADPLNAEAIILGSGMGVKRATPRQAQEFTVSHGDLPGTAYLTARYVSHATYIWQMSADPGNEASWKNAGMTTQSKFSIDGLQAGTHYYFRVSVVDRNGQGAWSNPLHLMAL